MFAPYVPPEQAEDSAVQDLAHRVARCAANPDVMWMQHHAGMYRSADAGAHWIRITPPGDDFGFAVVAHPHDGATAWFVPAIKDEIRMPRDGALCVTKTSDGGESWEVMRKGLPQRDAYDLVYRHGLDVDGSGDRLAMGSTTGTLWISEDGGGILGVSTTPICRRSIPSVLFEAFFPHCERSETIQNSLAALHPALDDFASLAMT